ncbi:hypothetical protein K9L63_01315 [Candidatus Gracilibacteria bacterium]|nr:hypothetical protein [Candidatus Gracilibacteria bacterium]
MKNPIRLAEWSIGKVILVLWILFSLVYVGNSLWNGVLLRVYQAGRSEGVKNAVMQSMELAKKCQPVVFSAGGERISLLNSACLQKQAEATPSEGVVESAETEE